jgi:Uma2 family endonuclease
MLAPDRVDDTRPLAAADVILAVEVLSECTADIDRGAKVDLWRQAGVDYWVVEPGDPWGAIEAHPFGRSRVDPEKL